MKKFTRKKEGQVFGGVTTGIAAYFDVDPLLVRLIALFLFIATGFVPLIIVYIVAVLAVPYDAECGTNDTP